MNKLLFLMIIFSSISSNGSNDFSSLEVNYPDSQSTVEFSASQNDVDTEMTDTVPYSQDTDEMQATQDTDATQATQIIDYSSDEEEVDPWVAFANDIANKEIAPCKVLRMTLDKYMEIGFDGTWVEHIFNYAFDKGGKLDARTLSQPQIQALSSLYKDFVGVDKTVIKMILEHSSDNLVTAWPCGLERYPTELKKGRAKLLSRYTFKGTIDAGLLGRS